MLVPRERRDTLAEMGIMETLVQRDPLYVLVNFQDPQFTCIIQGPAGPIGPTGPPGLIGPKGKQVL